MSCGSSIAGRNAVHDWCTGPHQVEEAQCIGCQHVVEAACDLERMTALSGCLDPKPSSRHVEVAEVQHMHDEPGRGLRPNQPGLGKSGENGDSALVADGEVDRVPGIRDQRCVLGSVGKITQLVHPYPWTRSHHFRDAPLRPTHQGSLWAANSVVGQPDRHGIRAAARSATMTVGMCVFADGMSGITEASTTHRPSTPWTRQAWSTTAPAEGSTPMAHVPTG